MLSSKKLNQNQNMLKMRIFLNKTSPSSGGSALRPRNLTHTNCTATKRSNFVAHKNLILITKFGVILVPPTLCDIAPSLHLVWRRH